MPRPATGQVVEKHNQRGATLALRFRAYGARQYVTLPDGTTRQEADQELQNVLADVRRGIWRPPAPDPEPLVKRDPTFREFASEWYYGRESELRPATREDYQWRLSHHLLPHFAGFRLSQITVQEVDRYRQAKVRDGKLAAVSINKTLTLMAAVLEAAVEYELIERNPAKGARRRLKVTKNQRVYLDRAEQITSLLEAAGELDREARRDRRIDRRPLLATLVFGGLRVGELCSLKWKDVDLANGRIRVGASKTEAGVRQVDMLPPLRDELLELRARNIRGTSPDALVFPTNSGKARTKDNIRARVLLPVMKRANERREEAELVPLPERLTPHGLRHTFASLLVAIGEDPRYVMGQLGHTDPAFTLRLYTHSMRREDGELGRLRALVATEAATTQEAKRDLQHA